MNRRDFALGLALLFVFGAAIIALVLLVEHAVGYTVAVLIGGVLIALYVAVLGSVLERDAYGDGFADATSPDGRMHDDAYQPCPDSLKRSVLSEIRRRGN